LNVLQIKMNWKKWPHSLNQNHAHWEINKKDKKSMKFNYWQYSVIFTLSYRWCVVHRAISLDSSSSHSRRTKIPPTVASCTERQWLHWQNWHFVLWKQD
jgi:hypothetical protein